MNVRASLILLLMLNAVLGILLYCASPEPHAARKQRPGRRAGRVLMVESGVVIAR